MSERSAQPQRSRLKRSGRCGTPAHPDPGQHAYHREAIAVAVGCRLGGRAQSSRPLAGGAATTAPRPDRASLLSRDPSGRPGGRGSLGSPVHWFDALLDNLRLRLCHLAAQVNKGERCRQQSPECRIGKIGNHVVTLHGRPHTLKKSASAMRMLRALVSHHGGAMTQAHSRRSSVRGSPHDWQRAKRLAKRDGSIRRSVAAGSRTNRF